MARAAAVAGRRPDLVAVYPAIDNGHAVAGLAHMHEAVGHELKASGVPGGVGVSGPLDVAELDLRRRLVGMDVDREGHLKQAVVLVPVDLGLHHQGPLPAASRRVCTARDEPKAYSTAMAASCGPLDKIVMLSGPSRSSVSCGKRRRCPRPGTC